MKKLKIQMTKEKAIRIFNKKSATKQELKKALAWVLGIDWEESVKVENADKQMFKLCKEHFCSTYKESVGLDYYWQAKDSGALKQMVNKLSALVKGDETRVLNGFEMIMQKLPKWYKDNAFSVVIINSKFNEIVSQIKHEQTTKGSISDDYKARIARDLLS